MDLFRYMRSAAFFPAVLLSGLLVVIPVGAVRGQNRTEPVAIVLKTTPVDNFAEPSPSVTSEIKPNFKEKSFALHEAVNAREMMAVAGSFNQDTIKFLEKNRFILLPESKDHRQRRMKKVGYDEMLSLFDQLGGSFQEHKREPQNARFVGPDIFLHAFQVYVNLRLEALESGRLRQVSSFMLDELLSNALHLKQGTFGPSRNNWERLTAQLVIPLILITNGEDSAFGDNDTPPPPPSDTLENAKSLFQKYRSSFTDSTARKINAELERIYKADSRAAGLLGLAPADGGVQIDYTRFSPRGRHGHKASGRAYYRTMVWLSELGWNINTPEGLADALNCVLAMSYDSDSAGNGLRATSASEMAISKAADKPDRAYEVAQSSDVWQAWATIMEINDFFLGHQSSPGFQQWLPFLMKEAEVDRFTADTAADEAVLNRLAAASDSLAGSLPLFSESRQLGAGNILCFFPARDSLIKYIAAELTYCPEIREDAPAVFSALYLPALMGHKYSRELTARQTTLDFAGNGPDLDGAEAIAEKARRFASVLTGRMDSLAAKLLGFPEPRRFSSLDSAWLHLALTLTREYGSGYPLYMRNIAYQAKQLETVLGSDTERLGEIIFARTAAAWSPPEEGQEDQSEDGPAAPVAKGFIEPNTAFWREMTRVVKYTADGFKKHGLFPEDLGENGALSRFLKRLERCAALAEKELSGQALTDDEYEFIRLFSLDFMAAPVGGGRHDPPLGTALLTDFGPPASGPAREGSAIVYQANAEPRLMLVMVGNDKCPRLAVGPAYNHYEIISPGGPRLTGEMWRKLVYDGRHDPSSAPKSKLPPKNFWYDPLKP